MNGSRATFSSCRRAASSTGTPLVHALIGAPSVSMISIAAHRGTLLAHERLISASSSDLSMGRTVARLPLSRSLRVESGEFLGRGGADAALGDQAGDKAGGSDVEGVIARRAVVGRQLTPRQAGRPRRDR